MKCDDTCKKSEDTLSTMNWQRHFWQFEINMPREHERLKRVSDYSDEMSVESGH